MPQNLSDPFSLGTVIVVNDGGGIGTDSATANAATHLQDAGWTVNIMSPNDFINSDAQFNGIILGGHGDANQSGAISVQTLESVLIGREASWMWQLHSLVMATTFFQLYRKMVM